MFPLHNIPEKAKLEGQKRSRGSQKLDVEKVY